MESTRPRGSGPRFARLAEILRGVSPAAKAKGNTSVPPPAKPKPEARYTAAALAAASNSGAAGARSEERARWAKVLGSPQARGRERGCIALLTSVRNWSAEAILAELGSLPTDAQLAEGTRTTPPVSSGPSVADRASSVLSAQRKAAGKSADVNEKAKQILAAQAKSHKAGEGEALSC